MEGENYKRDPIDLEVRAHVYSLVSAVGGSSADLDGRYVLGDDALACLKDLKKWLNLYDNNLNRFDVARCIADANLVRGDLLEILARWREDETDDRMKYKTALACVELLVPLTWPFEIDDTRMTVNHHTHIPYLQLAQVSYKQAVLHHDDAKILRTAIRVALPSMAEERSERSARDEGIIRIVLYFLRNVALISQPSDLAQEEDEAEVSRSATIDAFHYQDVFNFLLTMSSSIGDEFNQQDVMILETLFHLLKGVNPEKLFMGHDTFRTKQTDEFRDILRKEKDMLSGYAKHAPTRHNRFGTMIWVKREEEKVSTVSGQNVIGNADATLIKLDKQKKWNKPQQRSRNKTEEPLTNYEFDREIPLNNSGRKHLRVFIEEFLDSSFNPLFTHLRKAIEREAERVTPSHSRQYFYLVYWFLRAECTRREAIRRQRINQNQHDTSITEEESFGIVASVLNQETFVLLNRTMQRSLDEKSWLDLNAGMKCFTQILLTVQEMANSPNDEDLEIAENIQNRIFYEQTTHDRIISILRNFNPSQHSFGYLDACTELSHVFLRILERYSRQNVDLQIRTRRRIRKKRQRQQKPVNREDGGGGEEDEAFGNSDDDIQEAQRASSERKFDFTRFVARFTTQPCVDTFVHFLRYYRELDPEKLKRAHRFFYRVAFKMEQSLILFRLDILALFYRLTQGPEPLLAESNSQKAIFKEWEELVRQVFRRLVKKMGERKETLGVELLFSKIPQTMYYLEHGFEREITKVKPRPPAELEVKPAVEGEEARFGVAVGVLVDQGKGDLLKWIKDVLGKASDERKGWEEMNKARIESGKTAGSDGSENMVTGEGQKAPSIVVVPVTDEQRTALFKDNKLRLLLSLLGCSRLGDMDDPDASWIIPSSLTAAQLASSLNLIRKFEFDPPTYEDGKAAIDFVRSKAAGERAKRPGPAYDDDSEGSGDEECLFPAGGPTNRKSNALEELKQKRRVPRRQTDDGDINDEERDRRAEEKRAKREEAELEKRRKIKSELFVHDSDEEDDEERDKEFFAKEEAVRRKTADAVARALIEVRKSATSGEKSKKRKAREISSSRKKRKAIIDDEQEENESDRDLTRSGRTSSRSSSVEAEEPMQIISSDEHGEVETDTPVSSQQQIPESNEKISVINPVKKAEGTATFLDESEDDMPVLKPSRRLIRSGFIVESDSDE
ncbi:timeless-domain-containing protein [Viridothelium virens]|uniref:Topoisomerase 1-associated factor 1 n=1 Tax=Viridothelium virens TaxID=1048519 RepID=A0A6A6HFT2_VIRVR|nr:timeless-domain-containing protein [Viridothelium virens]